MVVTTQLAWTLGLLELPEARRAGHAPPGTDGRMGMVEGGWWIVDRHVDSG